MWPNNYLPIIKNLRSLKQLYLQDDDEKERKLREQRRIVSNFVKRVISHPQFHNVTFKDAEHMLQKFEQVRRAH